MEAIREETEGSQYIFNPNENSVSIEKKKGRWGIFKHIKMPKF